MPKSIPIVQRYTTIKYTPNHHVDASMTNLPSDDRVIRWPPRKTLVNMDSQTQVKPTMLPNIANPTISNAGLAAKIFVANSKIEIAFCMAKRLRTTANSHNVANIAGTRELHRMK